MDATIAKIKTCKRCKQDKHVSEFSYNKTCSDRCYPYCKPCVRIIGKERDPDRAHRENLKRFGLTTEQYRAMAEVQCGVCWICQKPECIPGRRLAVDHSHRTGNVRGLLCSKCNKAIGAFGDDPKIIARAAEYLELF